MPLRSVLDVEVNDASFQRFHDLFKRYQDELANTPQAWAATGEHIKKTTVTMEGLTAAMLAQTHLQHELATGQEKLTHSTAAAAGHWRLLAQSARQVGTAMRSIVHLSAGGTGGGVLKSLEPLLLIGGLAAAPALLGSFLGTEGLSWQQKLLPLMAGIARGGVGGGVAGALLSGGGGGGLGDAFLLSILKRVVGFLASGTVALAGIIGAGIYGGMQVLGWQRSALGLGTTIGGMRAFDLNLAPISANPAALLGQAADARFDIRHRIPFYMLGINRFAGRDTANLEGEFLTRAQQFLKRQPEGTVGIWAQMLGLDPETAIRLRQGQSVQSLLGQAQRDKQGLEISHPETWIQLNRQLTRTGELLQTQLINRLDPVATSLTNFSAQLNRATNDLMSGGLFGGAVSAASGMLNSWTSALSRSKDVLEHFLGLALPAATSGSQHHSFWQRLFSSTEPLFPNFDPGAWLKHFLTPAAPNTSSTGLPPSARVPQPPTPPTGPHVPMFRPDNPLTRLWHYFFGAPSAPVIHGDASLPRGIRNRNPLNLSYAHQASAIGRDPRFAVFRTMADGIAAAERQLLRYQSVYHLNTLAQIINRWAPPGENDTAGYIGFVSRLAHLDPNAPLNLSDPNIASRLIEAMAKKETGRFIDPHVVERGVRQALGAPASRTRRPAPKPNVTIQVNNNTGGSAAVFASQLAV